MKQRIVRKGLVFGIVFLMVFLAFGSLSAQADQSGSIVAWGWNKYGQCNVPAPNSGFIAIAAGEGHHNLGLKVDGSVVAWGYNNHGQCNVPTPNSGFVAIAAGGGHSLGLKDDGSVVVWGQNNYGIYDVPAPNSDFIAIAAGQVHSLGLKVDGSIVAWGYNGDGQCNVPAPNTNFVAIAAGFWHSLGLKDDGSVVAWGSNGIGQCNVPAPNSGFIAIGAGRGHSLGLKDDGSVVAWGDNGYGQCNVPAPNSGFVAIAAGIYHSLGLKDDGSIAAWGRNNYGQCNVPAPNSDFVAIAAGAFHGLALVGVPAELNTPTGTNVPVPFPEEGVTLTFQEVVYGGITTCTVTETGPPPPAGFRLVPSPPPTYYEITTTATYTGLITICINYDASDLKPGQEINLNLRQYDEATSEWVVITTSLDTVNYIICGETDHLSFFGIMLRLNDPPVASAGGPYNSVEGTEITFDAIGSSDPDGDPLQYRWDFNNDGTWDTDCSDIPTAGHTWFDEYTGTVKVEVSDGQEAGTDTATVTVNNANPEITGLTLPVDPVDINIPVELTGEFTETGTLDTHTAIIDWGDGNVDSIEEVTSPIPKQTHIYDLPGVYTITLTIIDDDGGSDSMEFRYVVVYDPEGGFVTGGGWIMSPAGAYVADPELEGKANFGFVSKYKKGATTPTGNTEFQFKAGDLNFHSNDYEWLVVSGARAQFKGTGTINGEGEYKFKLTAIDGDINGGGGVDKFRIKIWYEEIDEFENEIEIIVYDNGEDPGNGEEEVLTELGGGQIVIHTKGK
jgi:PKD repeat protein